MWLAQRDDLPDTHKLWADEGSQLEQVYRALGYVEVPAPGTEAKAAVSLVDDDKDAPVEAEA